MEFIGNMKIEVKVTKDGDHVVECVLEVLCARLHLCTLCLTPGTCIHPRYNQVLAELVKGVLARAHGEASNFEAVTPTAKSTRQLTSRASRGALGHVRALPNDSYDYAEFEATILVQAMFRTRKMRGALRQLAQDIAAGRLHEHIGDGIPSGGSSGLQRQVEAKPDLYQQLRAHDDDDNGGRFGVEAEGATDALRGSSAAVPTVADAATSGAERNQDAGSTAGSSTAPEMAATGANRAHKPRGSPTPSEAGGPVGVVESPPSPPPRKC